MKALPGRTAPIRGRSGAVRPVPGGSARLDGATAPLVLVMVAVVASWRAGWWLPVAALLVALIVAAVEMRRRHDVRTYRRRAELAERRDAERATMLSSATRALRLLVPAEAVRAVLLGDDLPIWARPVIRVDVDVVREYR